MNRELLSRRQALGLFIGMPSFFRFDHLLPPRPTPPSPPPVAKQHVALNVTIDRRTRKNERPHAIVFAVEAPDNESLFGHAFIIWQHEDDAKKMSVSDAIGFHPTGAPNTFRLIFGTPGALETDADVVAAQKLTVLVDSDVYQQALDAKAAWEPNGDYTFLWNNCVTHVADIAKAAGLDTSDGTWVTPHRYLEDLMSRNRPAPPPSPPAPPRPAPMRPAPRPAAPRRQAGPGIYDRGWGNGAGDGGSGGWGGGGGWSGGFGPR